MSEGLAHSPATPQAPIMLAEPANASPIAAGMMTQEADMKARTVALIAAASRPGRVAVSARTPTKISELTDWKNGMTNAVAAMNTGTEERKRSRHSRHSHQRHGDHDPAPVADQVGENAERNADRDRRCRCHEDQDRIGLIAHTQFADRRDREIGQGRAIGGALDEDHEGEEKKLRMGTNVAHGMEHGHAISKKRASAV